MQKKTRKANISHLFDIKHIFVSFHLFCFRNEPEWMWANKDALEKDSFFSNIKIFTLSNCY